MTYNFRNAAYNKFGTIDLELEHEQYGWIPFTASPDDVEESGREVYALALAGEVAPYVPPTAEDLRASLPPLTARQLRLGLVNAGISLASVQAVIDAMPEGLDKDKAAIEWDYATTFDRLHPLIVSIGSALGLSPETIDTMWSSAASY